MDVSHIPLYRAAKINETPKPWAVIHRDGPFGDDIVAGYIADEATAELITAALLRARTTPKSCKPGGSPPGRKC